MLPESLTKIIDEANINYQSSRFRDSANTFSNIASVCRREGYTLDGVYFSYRAALAHREDKNGMDEVKELMALIDHLIKSTLNKATAIIPDVENLRSKLQMMQRTEKLLGLLNKEEARDQVIQSIITLCEQLIDESELEGRMEFIKIVISYTHDEKTMADYKQKIFATYEMLGDEFAAKDDDFSRQMMGHSYGKAIRETSDRKLIEGILDKLLGCRDSREGKQGQLLLHPAGISERELDRPADGCIDFGITQIPCGTQWIRRWEILQIW